MWLNEVVGSGRGVEVWVLGYIKTPLRINGKLYIFEASGVVEVSIRNANVKLLAPKAKMING